MLIEGNRNFVEAVHLSTPLFSPFSVPWGLGSALHYTERQAPIAWATERLGFQPRLRSGQRGWLYDQGTIPGIHPSPHFSTPNNFGFVMKQQFFLLDPQVTAPPPICLSFHPLSGRPRNRRRLRTPGHETTAGTRKQEVTCLLDGVPGSPLAGQGPGGECLHPDPFFSSPRGVGCKVMVRTQARELSSRWPGGSLVLATEARRPAEDGVNVPLGPGPPSTLETGEPTGEAPRKRV